MWIKHLIVVLAVAAATYWSVHFASWFGVLQHIFNHAPGPCAAIRSIEHGAIDIDVTPTGIAFLSSGVWLFHQSKEKFQNIPGKIYQFDFNRPSTQVQELKIAADKNFKLVSPLGISHWINPKTGQIFVYVVSQQPTMNVDKFRFDAAKNVLVHLRRINDPNFIQLNDIAVVGEDQFYFTNFYRYVMTAELILGTHFGIFGYYNGTGSTILDGALSMPNGIALSANKKFVFVAHSGKKEIRVYKKESDLSLKFSHAIQVHTSVDKLFVDSKTGDLWAAAHPALYKTIQYVTGQSTVSPSQVIRVKLNVNGEVVKVEEIYSNDGLELPAASAAAVHGNRLLIGSIASHALFCEIK